MRNGAKGVTEKREKEIKLRLSDAEYLRLLHRAGQQPLAPWLRTLGLGERISLQRPAPAVDPQLLRQVAGIGNNLNQMARRLNQHQELSIVERLHWLAALNRIDRQLAQLVNEHRRDDR